MLRTMLLLWGGSLILAACAGPVPDTSTEVTTPTSTSTSAPTSTLTPTPLTPAPTSTPLPASPTPTPAPTATPLPASPTPAPEESTVTYNSDLNYAQVIFVRAAQGNDGLWTFNTTVRHNDEGWDHYADAWQVVDPADNVLAERVLAHPHDTEQPFTRSQGNIEIPPALTLVIVRAKCNIHGFGGQEVTVDLTVAEGENFEVIAR